MSSVNVSILVTSDAIISGEREDVSGKLAREMILRAGHNVKRLDYLPNKAGEISSWVKKACKDSDIILITGGTGVGPRDVSVEATAPLFEKSLPGFGELFRYETYINSGTIAWLSRAQAGIIGRCAVFVIPGSPDAIITALKLILPEVNHLKNILSGGKHGGNP